jgi:regulator of protease activity HflC (stomatin/prohibitin superfamily)
MVNTALLMAMVAAIPAAAIGYLLGRPLGYGILGAVTGSLIGASVSLFWSTKRRRWMTTAGLVLLFAFAHASGGWSRSAFTVAASVITYLVSAAVLRELYGGSILTALSHHLRLTVGFILGFQRVQDGATAGGAAPGFLYGPRFTIIGPNSAAVLESGQRQTRVMGPALTTTEPFEYVKATYDLRQQRKEFTFSDVLTADLVPTTVTLSATYGINIPKDVREGRQAWEPQHSTIVNHIHSQRPAWEVRTAEALETSTRRALAARGLEEVLGAPGYVSVSRQILGLAHQCMTRWDIAINDVSVTAVQPKQAVKDAKTELWIAGTEADTLMTIERGRAAAWRDALRLMADGYAAAREQGMSELEIHREVLRRTLEQIAKDPATKIVLTPEVDSALADLRRWLGVDGQQA